MNDSSVMKGEIYTWGWNNGQLGHPVSTEQELPQNVFRPLRVENQPEEFKTDGIKLLACGASHNVMVTARDEVFVFGRNQNGQLGLGHKEVVIKPTRLQHEVFARDGHEVVDVACGDRHTVFLTANGHVYVCGANFNGQLGLGNQSDCFFPTLLKFIQHLKVAAIACGSRHTVMKLANGSLYSTGYGLMGQLGIGSNIDVNVPVEIDVSWKALSIEAKEHITVALTTDFEVYMWGGEKFWDGVDDTNHPERNNNPRFVTGNICGRRVRDVVAAPYHCYARTSDGSLFGWGHKLGMGVGYVRLLPNILTEYGTFKEDDQLSEPAMQCKQRAPNIDEKHVVRESNDPSVFTLYKNSFLPAVKHVAATNRCTFCVTEDGGVLAYGEGKSGELGLGESVALTDYPTKIPDFKVQKLVCGYWHGLAIL